ncbi:HvfC family RiPP maturation protein [Agrilutibacter solisilvae]|uniref:DNA-binding domain-containing protein n=1 Tax=Agrilutibacter solisilvae TaxID=2763317 RepID=A0A974XWU8_9GAMM|nr:putative DNA-binding domain-containing protein [Lysobacter solisilvae]QSX77282.1 putative DNA-binding domain-containing protein [Lysobacter solisilvae]
MAEPDAPIRLREQQLELTRHLRDPDGVDAPPGLEARRVAVYRDLLFNNIENLLGGNFPVIRATLGEARWRSLVRDFYRDHRSQTPLFPEIAREFLRYLDTLDRLDPPFLRELAHYEWVELALQIAQVEPPAAGLRVDGDLLDDIPVLSPLAWPLAYAWPVPELGPDHQPDAPPPAPTLLLLRREADGSVRFSRLSPLAFRLVQRLGDEPGLTGRAQLVALAAEAGVDDTAAFLAQGVQLLEQFHRTGVVTGTRPA